MPLTTYPSAPFFDDFDETKNYLRTLFRPGHAVQARELTQLQTALQNQISRFGEHVFKDGSKIIGAEPSYNNVVNYVTVALTDSGDFQIMQDALDLDIGLTLAHADGVTAEIISIATEGANPVTDPTTFFLKYVTTSTDNLKKFFLDTEVLTVAGATLNGTVTIGGVDPAPVGTATSYTITDGLFFVNGNFVFCPAQTIIVDKYSSTPSKRIVLSINEKVVTNTDAGHSNLVDNANGAPNFAAPGAHRYVIELDLAIEELDIDAQVINAYVLLVVVENGVIQREARTTDYNAILDVFSTRTFEESGNYTVNPFGISVEEHPTEPATKMQVILEPSVAYVEGVRIQTIAPTKIDIDRALAATDIEYINNTRVSMNYGNYVTVTSIAGELQNLVNFSEVLLRNSGANIGTGRVRAIEYVSGTTYRVYLFDLAFTGLVSTWNQVYKNETTNDFLATIATPGLLEGTENNIAVFPLAYTSVKTLAPAASPDDIDYSVKRFITVTMAGGVVNISSSNPEVITEITAVANNDTGVWDSTYASVTGLGTSAVQFTPTSGTDLDVYTIQVTVNKSTSAVDLKSKTFTSSSINIVTPNVTGGSADNLGASNNIYDAIRVNAIYMSGDAGTNALDTDTDITDRYVLDNGQRDNFYGHVRLVLKKFVPAPVGRILVEIDHFTHGAGDFFSVDSYNTAFIDWHEIPSHISNSGNFKLHSVLDFRPTLNSAGTGFIGNGSLVEFPKAGSLMRTDMEIYLPRIDKLVLRKEGAFDIIKGVSAQEPRTPSDLDDAMAIYNLNIDPYTGLTSNIKPKIIDNRRYTMRDIGKIDKRVKNLEYYTTLSLLEQSVLGANVTDASGAERFKNGFVVDNFNGHGIGEVTNRDYAVSMDIKNGILRPHFHQDAMSLKIDEMGGTYTTDTLKHRSIVTLPFSNAGPNSDGHVVAIKQPYSSTFENLMPFLVFDYSSNIELNPESDDWVDVQTRPNVVINDTGTYDAIAFMAEEAGILGTEWNGWSTWWTGATVNDSVAERVITGDVVAGTIATTNTTTTLTTPSLQSNTGLQTELNFNTVQQNLGERTVDINFVPFIRSRTVHFYAGRVKPETLMYLFFDDVDITSYARLQNKADWVAWGLSNAPDETYNGLTSHPQGTTALISDANGELYGSFIVPSGNLLKFKTGTRSVKLTDDSTNNDNLSTSTATSTYAAQGLVRTSESTVLSTKVPQFETSETSAVRALVTRTVQQSIDVVVTPGVPPIPVASITPFSGAGNGGQGGDDPLAQTFVINDLGGAFITKIDAYFRTIATTSKAAVLCQIRAVLNGYPTRQIIAEKILPFGDAAIVASADASLATTFLFDDPVFLKQGVEYAFVLKAEDTSYEAWVSELGQQDITIITHRITKQPAAGVLFKSANDSTWTADQFKDLKFTMYRADFDISVPRDVILVNKDVPKELLRKDPIETYDLSTIVRIHHKNHGMVDGSKLTIESVTGIAGFVNGIAEANLEGQFTISNAEMDSYQITAKNTDAADISSYSGGSIMKVTENRKFDLMHTQLKSIVVPSTYLSWAIDTSPLAASPVATGAFTAITPNNDIVFRSSQVIPSADNEVVGVGKNLYIRGTMNSLISNLSPVVDTQRMSVIAISNRINNPTFEGSGLSNTNTIFDDPNAVSRFVDDLDPHDNSSLTKYITRKVLLENPASSIKIWVTINRPVGTDVALYYRLETDDTTSIDDTPWVYGFPVLAAPESDDAANFTEVEYDFESGEYFIDGSGSGSTFPDLGAGIPVDEFNAFQVKLVLLSNDSAKVPQVKEFRALAMS
jgi:hypothetical protein